MQQTTSSSAESPSRPPADEAAPIPYRRGENAVVWLLWLTYGSFYFCRTNISAAVPGMTSPLADGGLGLTPTEVGLILAFTKIAYGCGQFINGQLAERLSPRLMLAIGMFGSAALNALFGFSTGFYFLLFVWATNGFCQSLGWTPTMRVAVNWIPIARRGKAIGIIGTGYQITLGLTFLIAGKSVEAFGWRGAFYVPAVMLAAAGVVTLLCLRESPADKPLAEQPSSRPLTQPHFSFAESLYCTLYNPALWLLGLTLGLLNACRYGYLDWGLTQMVDMRNMPVSKAALQYFVIAIGAAAGSYLAGWATDRFFGGRRAPVICLLMLTLSGLSLVYGRIIGDSPISTMLLLVVIGFTIMGPQVLLVGTAPADLATRGTSAAAAGFVDFMGYIGAATGAVVTGYYATPEHGGWRVVNYIWAGWALAGAAVTALLWNATARRVRLMPSAVPKLGGLAAIAVAVAATIYAGQPVALSAVAVAAGLCAMVAGFNRLLALPAMLLAAASLITTYALYLRGNHDLTWNETAAMLAFGLAMLAMLMILVEQPRTEEERQED